MWLGPKCVPKNVVGAKLGQLLLQTALLQLHQFAQLLVTSNLRGPEVHPEDSICSFLFRIVSIRTSRVHIPPDSSSEENVVDGT